MSLLWTPRNYQHHAVDFGMAKPFASLMMDCGTGKTAVAASIVLRTLYDDFSIKRWLIVAPKRVATKGWPDELAKWQHLNRLPYRVLQAADFGLSPVYDCVEYFDPVLEALGTTMKKRGLAFGWDEDDPSQAARQAKRAAKLRLQGYREHVHIVSYDFLPWLVKAMGANWPYDGIVIDESSFIKNQDTERFRCLRYVRRYMRRVIELTGTPAPRGLLDLWSQFFLLDEGARLGATYGAYRDAFFSPDKRGRDGQIYSYKIDPRGKELIYGRISDIAMSLCGDDWLDLPPLVDNPIEVELPPGARALYDKVEHDLIALLHGSKIVAANAAVLCFKLLQISNGCVYDDAKKPQIVHDAKLDALAELLEATPGSVLCAYAFRHDIERIKKRFGRTARMIDSDADIDAWNAGRIKLGLGHPAGMGHGLNLQDGGNNACWFSPTYSAELYLQFIMRLRRTGQEADRVIVSHIQGKNTLDKHVLQVSQDHLTEQGALLASVKARVGALAGSAELVDRVA